MPLEENKISLYMMNLIILNEMCLFKILTKILKSDILFFYYPLKKKQNKNKMVTCIPTSGSPAFVWFQE